MTFNGRTILVTGARGYVGSAIIRRLATQDCTIIRASRTALPDVADGATKARYRSLAGDISHRKFWKDALNEGVDLIFHLAAQNSIYVAEEDPEADWQSNVLPMVRLLEACSNRNRMIDVVYAGTATATGLAESLPVSEARRDRPVTVYDFHKHMAEQYLELFAARGAVRGTTLRLANVYGAGEKVSSSDRGVLNKLIALAISGKPIIVYGEGAEVRDYIHIDNVAEAFLAAAEHMDKANGRHFFLASGVGHSLFQAFSLVAERVEARTGISVPVNHAPWPEGLSPIERRNFIGDISAIREALNWAPTISLADGIDRTIDAELVQ